VRERLVDIPLEHWNELFGDSPSLVADCAYCGAGYRFFRDELLPSN
jgi:hypothetical protein